MTEYTARIIGIVHRDNDVEDKLIAAPEGMDFSKAQIEEAIQFQEQYFESEVETLNNEDKTQEWNDTIEQAVQQLIDYLNSESARASIEKDPYWPKWDSPWWHMSLLYEIGAASRIPENTVQKMIEALNNHYLPFFPIMEEELPPTANPYTDIACHCMLGNMYQILKSQRKDIDSVLPWIRPWFLKYQLPDGGFNCYDEAYRESKKSSIVSSLPVWEAMLLNANTDLSDEEMLALDRAAEYLIQHKLIYRKTGELMDENFLKLQFPRFYSYDILRGLRFLTRWKVIRQKNDADEVIEFGIKIVQEKMKNGKLQVERSDLFQEKNLILNEEGRWVLTRNPSSFPLLTAVNVIGEDCVFLTAEFNDVKNDVLANQ